MAPKPLPSYGEQWAITLSNLAMAYGWDEDKTSMAVYVIAEQIHRHYCLSRGIVNHSEARPDQDVALSVLGALAGVDWWLVRGEDVLPPAVPSEPLEAPVEVRYFEGGLADDTTEG